MSEGNERKAGGVIGLRTAILLFVGLAAVAIATLRGAALWFALLIIGALAVKAVLHHLRSRIEER